jgi:hypothetical protein
MEGAPLKSKRRQVRAGRAETATSNRATSGSLSLGTRLHLEAKTHFPAIILVRNRTARVSSSRCQGLLPELAQALPSFATRLSLTRL